jgi:O-antigen/teichoic acid export membrane protein
MAGGLLVTGLAGYGFVALSGHTLPAKEAAGAAALYLLINLVGPGVFAALEQETNRSVSAALAAGGTIRTIRRQAAYVGGGLLVLVLVVLAGLAPVLVPTTLDGDNGLFVALLLGTVSSALVYLARGVLAGTRRFAGYAATLAGEGAARLLPCVLLAIFGAASASGYGLIFATGSLFGVLASWHWLRDPRSADPIGSGSTATADAATGMARRLLLLVGSTTLSQLLANLAPVVVGGRLTTNAPVVAAFTSAFVLARLPLTAFAPVQALMLPSLTAATARADLPAVRSMLVRIVAAAIGVGLLGTLAAGALGPWAVRVLFGAKVDLGWPLLTALGAGTMLLMLGLVLQPGLVALGRHRTVATSWAFGAIALVGLLFLPGDPLRAAIIAQLVGSGLVVVGMAAGLFAVLVDRSGTSTVALVSPTAEQRSGR